MTILLALTIIVTATVGIGSAARPIPPSNETSDMYVHINVTTVGTLISETDLVFTQGNGNLNDNPPLKSGEGVAKIIYTEDTVATSGSITYVHTVNVDTGSAPQNLETTRSIDYTNQGDGGRMYSSESVAVSETAAGGSTEGLCCPWPANGDTGVTGTSVRAEAGSEVDLREGSVNSASSAGAVSSDVSEDVEMDYLVEVDGSGQTGNETAEGHALVYVDVREKEGSGYEANQTTDMSYEETVHVDGLIEIAMRTGYSGQ